MYYELKSYNNMLFRIMLTKNSFIVECVSSKKTKTKTKTNKIM